MVEKPTSSDKRRGRSGEIPEPTVIVRMEESERSESPVTLVKGDVTSMP